MTIKRSNKIESEIEIDTTLFTNNNNEKTKLIQKNR